MCRGWIGSSKLTTELHKEALNNVSRVDLRTSQLGTQVVELGATRHSAHLNKFRILSEWD